MGDLLNRGINTTQGRLYIVTEKTLEKMEIQFVPPSISIDRKADFATVKVVGRNTPQYQFLSGETRMPLSLDFYADDELRIDAINKCRWLEALTALDGKKNVQRVKLIFGNVFEKQMWYVQSVKYDLSLFDRRHGYYPRLAKAEVLLVQAPEENLTWWDIR